MTVAAGDFSVEWESDKRIGLLLSGGLDSAVLLAALLHSAKHSGRELLLQIFTIRKSDGSHAYVAPILAHLGACYGRDLGQATRIGDGTLPHSEINKHAIQEIFARDLCDHVYLGLNQNPERELPGLAPARPARIDHPRVKAPFLPWRKTEIVALALKLGQEKLFALTHTCTEQAEGLCGKCWQCSERAWAFAELRTADPLVAPARARRHP